MSLFIGPLTKNQSEVAPCPCCGAFARLEYGRQYKEKLQSWHEPDEALWLPASIRCSSCGLSVARAANKAENKGASEAQLKAKELVLSAWNARVQL